MRTAAVAIGKLALLGLVCVSTAHAAIPSSERTALIALYGSAGGSSWTLHTGWNGASGTECSWYGVVCDGIESHVAGIDMPNNNLKGTLGTQTALTAFTNLQGVDVHSDSTSSTPNVLTGSIPALTSLKSLQSFAAGGNKLSGAIPALTGLTGLQSFTVDSNALTALPALTGLTNLQEFNASDNKLTGTIPALTGLANLRTFAVAGNQLTGSIPLLTGLTSLQYFLVDDNQLSSTVNGIPPLPATLIQFGAGNNLLTGSLPTFTGLPLLESFDAHNNQLSGTIPMLSSLGSLEFLYVSGNKLTGTMPAVSTLTNLEAIALGGNSLTGPLTTAPDNLVAGASSLCPNLLQTTPSGNDAKWNAATGLTHWYGTPFPNNKCDDLFNDQFELSN